jgi:glycosyltransferase involved in cell wall biosynthesis
VLTVVQVAYPVAPVGPDAVGGAEQVLSVLDDALVEAGHRSIVVAPEGSVVRGELVALPSPVGPLERALPVVQEHVRRVLTRLLKGVRPDLVHLHGVDWPAYVPEGGPPVLVTLHLPPSFYPAEALQRLGVHFNCVSESQRVATGRADLRVVPNGVRLGSYWPPTKRDYVACMGRLCPEKGYDLAIDAAKRAGVGLRLAGQLFRYRWHEAWFENQVRPRLDDERIFLGPVAGEARRDLLAGARALLVPSLVAETSSLVAMEAMAAGTPVIARRVGALTEVVQEGVTGLFADTVAEMADAIGRIGTIDPDRCRAEAERRFSHHEMAARYLDLYAELAPRRAARPVESRMEALEDVAREWLDLWERCPSAGVFQRPEWNLSWARHFASNAFALTVRRGARLVGLLPVYRHEGVLRILGAGISDHLDALVDPAHPDAWEALRDGLPDEPCSFDDVPAGSPLLEWPGQVAEAPPCPALVLDAAPRLDKCEAARRASERKHRVEVAEDRGLEALFALHAARWEGRGETGVLADPRVRDHHREVAATLPGVRTFVLRWDGAPVAAYYGFVLRDRATYYLGGFDPRFAKESPGNQVVGVAIQDAVGSGARVFDFLRGREAYKYAWGAADQPKRRLVRSRPGP